MWLDCLTPGTTDRWLKVWWEALSMQLPVWIAWAVKWEGKLFPWEYKINELKVSESSKRNVSTPSSH